MYDIEPALELYAKLAEVEAEVASGAKGVDFFEFAKKLRAEMNAGLQKSLDDYEAGKTYPAEEVFAELDQEFGI